jgi:hypothetical protein
MVTFHIRKPITDPKRRHVKLHHVDLKGVATFCGAAPTEHDSRSSASDWADTTPIGNYQPCPACIEAKRQANRSKTAAGASAAAASY